MPTPYALQPRNVRYNMGVNAGVLLRAFDVESGAARREDIIGATDGPVRFVAKPRFADLGAGVGNCPRNVREMKLLKDWEARLTGAFVSADTAASRGLIALCDAQEGHLVPRAQIDPGDFDDLWLVFDYGPAPGHYAIHMRNVLSTGGLQVRAQDRENARWPFEFTAHYLADNVGGAVFEVWIGGS